MAQIVVKIVQTGNQKVTIPKMSSVSLQNYKTVQKQPDKLTTN